MQAKRRVQEQSPPISRKKRNAKQKQNLAEDQEKPSRRCSALPAHIRRTPSPSHLWGSTSPRAKQAERPARFRIKTNKNGRDPFVVLDDDVVHQIINYLSAADTEYIRRVSRLWKLCSEIHCGISALKRHFASWTTWPVSISPDDANLHYRRWLYYTKSLEHGFATKATTFSDVHSWQIERRTLLRADYDSNVTLRSLDRRSGSDRQINLQRLLGPEVHPTEVQLTKQGDLIVKALDAYLHSYWDCSTVWACGNTALSETPCTYIFMVNMNTSEPRIEWQKKILADIAGPAIGQSSIYILEGSSEDRATVRRFTKLALLSGETEQCIDLPIPSEGMSERLASPLYGKQLAVSVDEELTVWRADDCVSTHCTSTFRCIRSRRRGFSPVWFSCYNRGYWLLSKHPRLQRYYPTNSCAWGQIDVDYHFCHLTSEIQDKSIMNLKGDIHMLDDETHTCIYVSHPDDEYQSEWSIPGQQRPKDTLDPFAGLVIMNWETESKVPITLRSRNGGIGRRPLAADLPWSLDPADENHFLGMQDGYIVYFDREEARLIVVDFWPTW